MAHGRSVITQATKAAGGCIQNMALALFSGLIGQFGHACSSAKLAGYNIERLFVFVYLFSALRQRKRK
jgi:hypothetical protein